MVISNKIKAKTIILIKVGKTKIIRKRIAKVKEENIAKWLQDKQLENLNFDNQK